MKERPIIFSGPMVRAILEDRKTQTRRICKLPPDAEEVTYWSPPSGRSQHGWADPGVNYQTQHPSGNHIDPCPYGQPGDRLWVRESFSAWFQSYHWYEVEARCRVRKNLDNLFFRATHHFPDDDQKWVPSIFMPRWASRITLEITKIRVERLQEITEEDAKAEGITIKYPELWPPPLSRIPIEAIRGNFFMLWDHINAKRRFGWDKNPWVWVIEFKRL